MTDTLKTAGWREWASLPDLGVTRIKGKLDTGARTSALHVYNLNIFEKEQTQWVNFDVHPIQANDELICSTCTIPVKDRRIITSSTGHQERRIIIETKIKIGDESWPIEVSLTNRDQMGFRFLIGRTALEGRILVDPASSYLLAQTRRRRRESL